MKNQNCTFGTSKSYLAVACIVEALEKSDVRRLVLVHPMVETE
ncbi:PhoH family protein [Candidatus Ruthturnera calyptogenae]|nr:PhoH family protein [Candidatus Ruthturnera calyptogenae]